MSVPQHLETFLQYLQRINNVNPSLSELIARNDDYKAIADYLTAHLTHDNDHIRWMAEKIAYIVFVREQYLTNVKSTEQLYETRKGTAIGTFLSPTVTRDLNIYDNEIRSLIEQLRNASQFYTNLQKIPLGGKKKTKRYKKRHRTRRK